jgi:hypothetical protein
MPVQHETGWETDQEGYNEGSNIGFERNKAQMQDFLVQNIVVGYKKNANIQYRIEAPAGGIPECLFGKYFSKGRVEKIND